VPLKELLNSIAMVRNDSPARMAGECTQKTCIGEHTGAGSFRQRRRKKGRAAGGKPREVQGGE
jgi:hypothetical protein